MSAAPPVQNINIPLLPELFNPQTHRLDAGRMANALGIPVGSVAAAIGRKAEASANGLMQKSPDRTGTSLSNLGEHGGTLCPQPDECSHLFDALTGT